MKKQKIIASILSAVFSANLLMVNTSQAKITEPQETNIQITQSAEEEIQNLEMELEKLKDKDELKKELQKLKDKETDKNNDTHIKHLKGLKNISGKCWSIILRFISLSCSELLLCLIPGINLIAIPIINRFGTLIAVSSVLSKVIELYIEGYNS